MVNEGYDFSWDLDGDEYNEKAWNRKYKQWQSRDWVKWLDKQLTFPFQVERMEDDLDPFAPEELHAKNPFPVGCKLTATGISDYDCDVDFEGIIVDVEGRLRKGCVPLQDLEVRPKSDSNYWPVREFVVWYANR